MTFWAIIFLLWMTPALLLIVILVRASMRKSAARGTNEKRELAATDKARRAPAE